MAKQIDDDGKFTGVRLPQDIYPIKYILKFKPNFEVFTFTCEESIVYETKQDFKPTRSVVVHSNELVIIKGNISSSGSASSTKTNQLVAVTYSKTTETATLEFEDVIEQDGGVINLEFSGILNDRLKGFYRTSFLVDGIVTYAGTTQFAATDARLCFPCWDEPNFKATFVLSLVIDRHMTINGKQYERVALSNTCEESRSGPDNETVIKFQETPVMSTYLLAFAVGPFEYIEGATDTGRPIRIYTTPGKKEQGRFALEVAIKSLQYYEDYFNIKYPLPKMDLIAIPDFALGAMENWGLITYRETCLLVDSKNTATSQKQWIAIIVAHEVSHQWFGNLVTMEWWTHLWLNEGFASFMPYLCVDHIFPEYDIWAQFLSDTYACALTLDALHNSHPIEVPVNHPSEIDEIFDAISYKKGASVIRMLYEYIGDDCFRKGMTDYLTKFAYKNAITEDLWDCLEAASNKPVRKIMSTWTSQKGFPWLSVEYARHTDSETKLTLRQSKFSADGQLLTNETSTVWMIPIKATFGKDPSRPRELCLLQDKTHEIVLKEATDDTWIKLNSGSIGIYRTAYPESMSAKLWPAILDKTLPPMDRFGLQNEFFALCQAGKVKTVEFLKLLQSYREETNHTVWASIDQSLQRLSILLAKTDYREKFHSFGCRLLQSIFAKLTWNPQENESHTQAMTRALVLNRLVSFGDQAVVNEAKCRFVSHADGTSIIPADLRQSVYKAISIYGDDDAFMNLFTIYRKHELQEEKNRAALALGYSRGIDRLEKVIKFALSDEVRDQDKIAVISPIGQVSPLVGWKMLKENKDFLRKKYERGVLMGRLIKSLTENFTTEAMAQEMTLFFEQNKFPGSERTIQQSIETVESNAKWLARDDSAIRAFLVAQ